MPLGTERPTRDYIRAVPSHKTDHSRITARRSQPDWFSNYVQPQLETFWQQPIMQVKGLAEGILGDPTDPANLAVGFMTPARRLEQAKKLADELKISQNIYAGYGAEHRGIKSLQNAVEKYPHLMGHFADVGMLPETSMPKTVSGEQTAGYFQRIKAKPTKELNLARETADPNYRMKLSQEYGIAGKWGKIPQERIDRGITRHELGHAATALADQPSALNYTKNNKYGYHANPDEIRANAIAAKRKPRAIKNHGDYSIDTYESSFPKNDYMKRLQNEMFEALIHPTTKDVQKRQFARDFMNYEVDLPPQFYNYYFSQPGNRQNMESFLNIGRSPGVKPVKRTP